MSDIRSPVSTTTERFEDLSLVSSPAANSAVSSTDLSRAEEPDPYDATQEISDGDDVDDDDDEELDVSPETAESIIGGSKVGHHRSDHESEAEEQLDQEKVTRGDLVRRKFKNEHKIFTFSLPFGSSPSSFLPSFKHLKYTLPLVGNNDSSDEDFEVPLSRREIKHKLKRQESISTLEEEYFFKDVKGIDSSRLRAVRRAFTPSITLSSLLDDEKKKETVWDAIDGDIVILGGYRGSILRDAKTHRRVWIPIRAGFNIRKIDLLIGPTDEDEIQAQKKIIPDGMMTHLGPVDISKKLIQRLSNGKTRIHDFGYDWRLSSDINSKKLHEFLSTLESTKPGGKGALVIAHSMGGLIAHHVMQEDPTLFRGLVYVGVPAMCPNILGPVRYGDAVLFSNKILTPEANFFMRSSFVFLPTDGRCWMNKKTHEQYNLDYFDVNTWIEYGLSPLVSKDRVTKSNKRRNSQDQPVANKPSQLLNVNIDMKRSLSIGGGNSKQEEFLTSYEDSVAYLDRTLKRTKKFIDELKFDKSKKYPPLAMVYGNEVPTVRGGRVNSREDIKRGKYEDFYYGHGDGVVHNKWLMPERLDFPVVAKVASGEGHISLMTDLQAMGDAIEAILDEERERDLDHKANIST